MKKYVSQVTHVVKWLFKYGFFKDNKEAEEIIKRLEYADDEVLRLGLKGFGYMGYLDIIRKSQSKDKNLNKVGRQNERNNKF